MKLIAEITHKDITGEENLPGIKYEVRKGAKAVLLNDKNQVGLMVQNNSQIHKLPGGGFDLDEKPEDALTREVREETGYDCNINNELGLVLEYRDELEQLSISYVYVANVEGEAQQVQLTADEMEMGMRLEWFELDDAIKILSNDKPDEYIPKFIVAREKLVLQYFFDMF